MLSTTEWCCLGLELAKMVFQVFEWCGSRDWDVFGTPCLCDILKAISNAPLSPWDRSIVCFVQMYGQTCLRQHGFYGIVFCSAQFIVWSCIRWLPSVKMKFVEDKGINLSHPLHLEMPPPLSKKKWTIQYSIKTCWIVICFVCFLFW